MSLQLAAQHLAAQGRGPDKNLVHMSPREVAGLQALAKASGGSLSINPKTGLPEAGFLENMLPMLIGIGVTAMTGGAATPLMLGLGMGGLQTIRTGSLEKGLLAGLGAYGGAGLAGGLLAAGAGTAASTAGAAGAAGAEAAAAGAAGAGAGTAGAAGAAGATAPGIDVAYDMLGAEPFLDQAAGVTGGAASGAPVTVGGPMGPSPSTLAQPTYIPPYSAQPTTFSPPSYGAGAEGTLGELQAQQAQQAMQQAPSAYSNPDFFAGGDYARPAAPTTPMPSQDAISALGNTGGAPAAPTTVDRLGQMGRGLKALSSEEGRGAFLSGTKGGEAAMKYGLASALPLMQSQKPKRSAREKDYEQMRFVYDPGRVEDPEADYTGAASGERRYFNPMYRRYALGGPVEAMSAANVYDMQNARGGVSDMGIDNSTGMQRMAGGGISHLGDYSDGGRLLKGPGDGVSDSIPAVIGNKQPARLADGEFVVPARIVSELGNGSTDAGARKLYAMMDRIQKARNKTTGKNRVAANTRSEKYLPA